MPSNGESLPKSRSLHTTSRWWLVWALKSCIKLCTLRIGPPALYAGGYHSTTAKIRKGRPSADVTESLKAMAFKVIAKHRQGPNPTPRPRGLSGVKGAFKICHRIRMHPCAVFQALKACGADVLQLAAKPFLPWKDKPHFGPVHHLVWQQAVQGVHEQPLGVVGNLSTSGDASAAATNR